MHRMSQTWIQTKNLDFSAAVEKPLYVSVVNLLYHNGYHSSVTSWPHSICSPWRCWHSPCSWYLGTSNRPTHPTPWIFHPSSPVAVEATSLMGTAYLYQVPYQIVDTKRYPCNENIFLLLTLTLAYMDLHRYPRWDKQLLCSMCVGGCECLWVSTSADRCIK